MTAPTSCPKCGRLTEKRELFRFFYDHCSSCDALPEKSVSAASAAAVSTSAVSIRDLMDEFLEVFTRKSGYAPSHVNLRASEFTRLAQELGFPSYLSIYTYRGVNVCYYPGDIRPLQERLDAVMAP